MQAGRPALAGAGYTCQRLLPARRGIVLVLVPMVVLVLVRALVVLLHGGPGRSHCRRGREQ